MDENLAREILFEVDYWKAVLDDIDELNEQVTDIAGKIEETMPITIKMLATLDIPQMEASNDIMDKLNDILNVCAKSQNNIVNISELANGRLQALRGRIEDERSGN